MAGMPLAGTPPLTTHFVKVHGDYDPHPAEGVKKSLTKITENFESILLKKCEHKPWIEQNAKTEFYKVLKAELI